MSDAYEVDPGTPTSTHRSRPSVATQASTLAASTISYGSIMSRDGLARLSQFPPPPGFGIFYDPGSPTTSDAATITTPPMTPTGRAFPTPPVPPLPNNISQRKQGHFSGPVPPSAMRMPVGPPPNFVPPPMPGSAGVTSSGASVASSGYPSPHDWHDGSSSIASDPYGESVLSTTLITSLLSSVTASDSSSGGSSPQAPQRRDNYEPSVVSNAMSVDSTITYPPSKSYPLVMAGTQLATPPTSIHERLGSLDIVEPVGLHPPLPHFLPGGRSTPDTVRSFDTLDQRSSLGTVMQDANSLSGSRTMSMSPSMQSMNSTTPLIHAVPREQRIEEEEEPTGGSSPYLPSPSTPSRQRQREHRQPSIAYSSKTTKSYVSSLIARISHASGTDRTRSTRNPSSSSASWFRKRPLPPVPPLPHNMAAHDIRQTEDALPLPTLMNRAQALEQLLDKGHRPHHSMYSEGTSEMKGGYTFPRAPAAESATPSGEVIYSGLDPDVMRTMRGRKDRSGDWSYTNEQPDTPTRRGMRWSALSRRKRIWIWVVVGVVAVGVVVAVVVGVVVGKKPKHKCPKNTAGATCSLNATCVCTGAANGQCNQLAQHLLDLVPSVNSLFDENFTPVTLSTQIWEAQGAPAGGDCSSQLQYIDVSPQLDSTTPNRTTWAESALLWNLALSVDLNATSYLQDFARTADWKSLASSDGPSAMAGAGYSTEVSGYQFDFAAQTLAPAQASFAVDGEPSSSQLAKVNSASQAVLDSMYTHAVASSIQQQHALLRYWTNVLQQRPADLPQFVSSVRGAEVVLPFDSTLSPGNQPLANLLTNSSTTPFPPPLACYPGLTSTQLQLLNSFETTVFGLPVAASMSTFDTACYPNRPIYGMLDILQLRLPFPDSRTGVAKQGAVLSRDASSRVVIYNGEILSPLPGGSPNSTPTVNTDLRSYGTLNNLNHVLLRYLSSIGDPTLATDLVKFVLSSQPGPPANTSALYAAIPKLPVLEVAVFGTVTAADVQYTVSSFSDPKGALYFGSTASADLRDWTINGGESEVVWAESATAPEVVRDKSLTDPNFDLVWTAAYNYFHVPNKDIVTVSNITAGFVAVDLLGP